MIRNLFFDLDETLFDFGKSESVAIKETMLNYGVTPSDEFISMYSEVNLSCWKLLEQGKITRQELKSRRFALFFGKLADIFEADNLKELAAALRSIDYVQAAYYYEDMLSRGHYYIEGAEESVHSLSDSYSLYLVSNGTYKVQMRRLEGASITKRFEQLFISEEIGHNKPSKRFFDICLDRIIDKEYGQTEGAALEELREKIKSETVIIGDSLSSDIQGGINAGIRTIWFNHAGKSLAPDDPQPDYIVTNHEELRTLLREDKL